MKKYETIEIKVIGGINKDFIGCASCKYADLPEASCRIIGCIHAFTNMHDCFIKENKDAKK